MYVIRGKLLLVVRTEASLRRQDDAVVLDKVIQQAQHLREEVRGALGVEASARVR